MNFDKTAYRASKNTIVDQIKNSHDWKGNEGFIADGVICPDVYEKQEFRILCVLAESYGYDRNGHTEIEDQLKDDLMGLGKPSVKTVRRLSALLWLLKRSLESGVKHDPDSLPGFFTSKPENVARLQTALSKVAWINVKKASRADGTKMDAAEVFEHATRNAEVLKQQIGACAPHLVIVSGEVPFRALQGLELLGPGVALGKKMQLQGGNRHPFVIETTHPAYRAWGTYAGLYNIFSSIYDSLSPHLPSHKAPIAA